MTWTRSTTDTDTAALLAAAASARRDVEATRLAVARGEEGHAALDAAEYRMHCALRSVDRARAAGRTARLALAMEVHDELGGDAAWNSTTNSNSADDDSTGEGRPNRWPRQARGTRGGAAPAPTERLDNCQSDVPDSSGGPGEEPLAPRVPAPAADVSPYGDGVEWREVRPEAVDHWDERIWRRA